MQCPFGSVLEVVPALSRECAFRKARRLGPGREFGFALYAQHDRDMYSMYAGYIVSSVETL